MRVNLLTRICLLWGIFWGSLGLIIYFFGLMNLWYKPVLISVMISWAILVILFSIRYRLFSKAQKDFKKIIDLAKKDYLLSGLIVLFILFIILYFIGAIAPELEFDALWYHLTIPKIYLFDHSVHYIPGGLFYYSLMPRLSEMLYGVMLAIDPTGILAKVLHFSFGVFWAVFVYEILRIFYGRKLSLLMAILLFSLQSVAWLSQTAYIDLIVIFYSAGVIWGTLMYFKEKNIRYLYLAGVFMGFSLLTKTYSLMLLAVISASLLFTKKIKPVLIFVGISIALGFPFYLEAFLKTGNPIYPVFSIQDSAFSTWIAGASTYKQWLLQVYPTRVWGLLWRTFVYIFTPVLGLVFLLPLVIKKKDNLVWLSLFILTFFFVFWSLHPVWEPRYFLVILPLVAILVLLVITRVKSLIFQILIVILIVLSIGINANDNFQLMRGPISLLLGRQTRSDYLMNNFRNDITNFTDVDGFFKNNLKKEDRLLTLNYHNLFYAPDNFVDWSRLADNSELSKSANKLREGLVREKITYIALSGRDNLAEWFNFPENDVLENFELVKDYDLYHYYKVRN